MAGVLLFLSKNPQNEKIFSSQIQCLKRYINNTFQPYFKNIIFNRINSSSYLVEFRKDDQIRLYLDARQNWLSFEGTVFALNETKMYSAEELWCLYRQFGENFVNKLDGQFVIKIYDSQQNRYFVISDIIKNKTNFWVENDNFIIFTPFLLTTGIVKKPELDVYAFNEFMWRYYILSERSILKDVKRLSPATIYTIQNGKVDTTTYWEFPRQLTDLSFSNSVDKMIDSIQETAILIHKSFGKPNIDLTLGQDSRTIVASFKKQNLPFVTSTYGKSNFFEVRNVKEMAKRHNIENHNIQLTQDYIEHTWKHFEKSLILGNSDEPGYLLGRILFMRDEQTRYGNVLLNGAGGPFYKDCFWEDIYALNLYREPKRINIGRYLKLRILNKNYSDSIFKHSFLKIKSNSENYFTEMISKTVDHCLDIPVSMQIDKFAFMHWQNYGIASNSAAHTLHNAIAPLLLRRNLEIGLSLLPRWKNIKSKFQRAVIYAIDPELAKEKTDFGGINMVPKNIFTFIPFFIRYAYHQSARFRKKIRTKLGLEATTLLQEAWDYLPVYKLLFNDSNFKENLNYNNMLLSEIIKENEWNKFLKKFQNKEFQTVNNFEYLFKIVSVEYFMKKAGEL